MKQVFTTIFILVVLGLQAQNDTILVKNGNTLFGEIKKIRSGVLTMKTSYSDSDFTIDFSDVVKISIEKKCFVILTGGRRLTGYLKSNNRNEFTLTQENGLVVTYQINDNTCRQ